jgi:hypothetical protein
MTNHALGQAYRLAETISLSDIDILNLGTDGTNLLVLNNGDLTDSVAVFTPTGVLVREFPTGSQFCRGITWDGTSYVFMRGVDARSLRYYRMAPGNGDITGPVGPDINDFAQGLSFDGTSILQSHQAFGDAGVVTAIIAHLDTDNFSTVTQTMLTADTGDQYDGTPVYGVAKHNGQYFLSYSATAKVFRFDTIGNVIGTIDPVDGSHGIVFIGEDLFVADRGEQVIHRFVVVVPEPSAMLLYLFGLAGIWLLTSRSG